MRPPVRVAVTTTSSSIVDRFRRLRRLLRRRHLRAHVGRDGQQAEQDRATRHPYGLIRRWNSGSERSFSNAGSLAASDFHCFGWRAIAIDNCSSAAAGIAGGRMDSRQRHHRLLVTRIDLEGLLRFSDGVGVLAGFRQRGGAGQQPLRHAHRHVEQAAQFLERLRRIVHADVDDAFNGGIGVGRDRAHDEDAGGLHAAGIAAFRLSCIERIHQALGHRAFAAAIRRCHRLDDRRARERVALRGEVFAGDVPGIAAEMHEILGIGIAIDDALAGVDRGSPFGIDHRHLACIAAGIFVGDALHHLGR